MTQGRIRICIGSQLPHHLIRVGTRVMPVQVMSLICLLLRMLGRRVRNLPFVVNRIGMEDRVPLKSGRYVA